jgi:hypothetical protein
VGSSSREHYQTVKGIAEKIPTVVLGRAVVNMGLQDW